MPGKNKEGNKVSKMMGPEEISLLEDLQSILSELLSLNNAGTPQTSEGTEGSSVTDDQILAALKKLAGTGSSPEESSGMEDDVEKENNGPTASETADERLEPETDINDKNMGEVGKALMLIAKSLQPKQKVKKANPYVEGLKEVLGPIVNKIEEIEKFNVNMMDALGVTKSIERSVQKSIVPKKNSDTPVQNYDATQVVKELINVIKGNLKQASPEGIYKSGFQPVGDHNDLQTARKNLKDALPFIFEKKLNDR